MDENTSLVCVLLSISNWPATLGFPDTRRVVAERKALGDAESMLIVQFTTGNDKLSVNVILSSDYDPIHFCSFKTTGQATLAASLTQRQADPWPINVVNVGPPQPIISVTCSGFCLGIYGEFSGRGIFYRASLTSECVADNCYNSQGQYVGSCCNGFCAANKCRPWNSGH